MRKAFFATGVSLFFSLISTVRVCAASDVLEFKTAADTVNLTSGIVCASNTPFSVEYWLSSDFKRDAVYSVIYSKDGNNFSLRHDSYNWIRRLGQNLPDMNSGMLFALPTVTFYFDTNLENNQWNHIAVTRDEENNLQIYVNGVLTGSRVWEGELRLDRIGKDFSGRLADLRVWDHARSETEIEYNLYRRLAGTEGGLTGYWPLNDGAGAVAGDLTSAENNGAIVGANWVADSSLPLVEKDSAFIPSAPMTFENLLTGSTRFVNTNRVKVADFTVPPGADRYQVSYSADPSGLSESLESWENAETQPHEFDFPLPESDGDVTIYAWFTNSSESVTLRRSAGTIRYTTAAPQPSVAQALTRDTDGFTVQLMPHEIDSGSEGGVTGGESIPVYKLEVADISEPGINLTPTESFVTLPAEAGLYPVKLRVTNEAGTEALSEACSVMLVETSELPSGDRYVVAGNLNAEDPFDSWETAAADIQSAVDAAADNDRILVSRGIYQGSGNQIVSITGPLQLIGIHSREEVVLDGGGGALGNRRGIVASLPDTGAGAPELWIENLTVRRCYVMSTTGGAGIGVRVTHSDVDQGSLTIRNCAILDNQGIKADSGSDYYKGTGLYVLGKAGSEFRVNIADCLMEGNFGIGRIPYGAGMYLDGARFTVERSNFLGNHTLGIRQQESWPRGGSGAGAYISNATEGSVIRFCRFENNITGRNDGSWGGGLYVNALPITVENCNFINNQALYVGGVFFRTAEQTNRIINCLISRNHAYAWGGGVAVYKDTFAEIENCTVVANAAVNYYGGVVANYENSGFAGKNLIVVENLPGNLTGTSRMQLQHSCSSSKLAGTGNIVADPQFVDPMAGNYRIAADSPCRDAGLNDDWMQGARDLDGRPRLDSASGIVDMGCYEYQANGAVLILR